MPGFNVLLIAFFTKEIEFILFNKSNLFIATEPCAGFFKVIPISCYASLDKVWIEIPDSLRSVAITQRELFISQ